MTEPEIKACPFCGRETITIKVLLDGDHDYIVAVCEGCYARGPYVVDRHIPTISLTDITISKWNSRHLPHAEMIMTRLKELIPSFTIPGGIAAQIAFLGEDIVIVSFPNFNFELKLFRDGSWEVEKK